MEITITTHIFNLIKRSAGRVACACILLALVVMPQGCIAPPPLPPLPPLPEWTQTYEGATLPDDQEVKLYHQLELKFYYRTIIVIDNVIYTKAHDDPKITYKLKPGVHRIDYYRKVGERAWAIGGFTIEMKAGHTYVLKHEFDTNFHLFYFRPWETTVILRDKTDDEDVRMEHFPSPMSWDSDIQKLYEKYMEVGK